MGTTLSLPSNDPASLPSEKDGATCDLRGVTASRGLRTPFLRPTASAVPAGSEGTP